MLSSRMIWLLAHSLHPSNVSNLSLSLPVFLCVSIAVTARSWGRGGGRGGRGTKSYDCQKAWPSINHSILYAVYEKLAGMRHCLKVSMTKCWDANVAFTVYTGTCVPGRRALHHVFGVQVHVLILGRRGACVAGGGTWLATKNTDQDEDFLLYLRMYVHCTVGHNHFDLYRKLNSTKQQTIKK